MRQQALARYRDCSLEVKEPLNAQCVTLMALMRGCFYCSSELSSLRTSKKDYWPSNSRQLNRPGESAHWHPDVPCTLKWPSALPATALRSSSHETRFQLSPAMPGCLWQALAGSLLNHHTKSPAGGGTLGLTVCAFVPHGKRDHVA